MRRVAFAVAPLFALALALPAFGQQGKSVTTLADNDDTVKVTVNGGVDLDYVYRSKELGFHIGGFQGGGLANSETTVEGQMYAGFNIDLNDKISGHFEFGTRGVDGGATTYYGSGASALGGPPGAPPATVGVREAHVKISEFLSPELSLQLGLTTWSFNVRGKGGAFAFDPRNSSSIAKNLTVAPMAVGGGGFAANSYLGGNLLDVLDTYGAVGTYSSNLIQVDLVLLPVVVEGGPARGDEALYAVDFFYTLDEASGSRVAAILALSNHAGNGGAITSVGSQIITFGGGVTLNNLVPNLELWGELYFQFGDAGDTPGGVSNDAGGIGLQIGAEYNFGGPFLGAKINYLSGDDAADDSVDNFVSYENVNDLAILEDMWWGLDVDTNYIAFKVNGGFVFSFAGGQDNFTLEGVLGIFSATEDVATGAGPEDGLGQEIDIKATWALNSQFNLHAAVAYLFGSDLLEESMGGAGTPDAEDSATLFYAGFGFSF